MNTFIDLISLIFMEIWSTLAELLPKKPVLLPKIKCFTKIFLVVGLLKHLKVGDYIIDFPAQASTLDDFS